MKRNAKQKWREFPWGEILEYRLGASEPRPQSEPQSGGSSHQITTTIVSNIIWQYLYLFNIRICQTFVFVFLKYKYRNRNAPNCASGRWQKPSGDNKYFLFLFLFLSYLYLFGTKPIFRLPCPHFLISCVILVNSTRNKISFFGSVSDFKFKISPDNSAG